MTDTDSKESSMSSPEEALSVLGDETRLTILQRLGEADDPLAFSELFDRVEYKDPSNFNYHLKKLTGDFVHKTDDGYVLRQAGRRVIEAVLAEAQAADVEISRTQVDLPCFVCGAPSEISYRQAHVGVYCSDCDGTRNETSALTQGRAIESTDVLGILDLPPAGVADRTPMEVLRTAHFWTTSEALSLAREICPRCSALLDNSLRVCSEHDATNGHCEECGQRFGVVLHHNCTNCIFSVASPFGTYLLDNSELIRFFIDHDIDPLALTGVHLSSLTETIRSIEPFEAQFTFTIDDESLTLNVDDELAVVDVSRRDVSGASEE